MSTVLHHGAIDASPPPGGGDRERTRVGISQVLLATSLVVTFVLAYLFVLSGLEQGRAQSDLYSRLRSELAEGTAPLGAPIDPGAPVALLDAPQVGIEDVVVVEGTRSAQLQDGPGHVLGSVLPGQQGVSMVAGRSVSFGGTFARISELGVGSAVTVTTAQGVFTYEVSAVRREGDPLPPAPATGASRLTLLTADRGGIRAGAWVFVDAELEEGAAPAGQVAVKDTVSMMSAHLAGPTLALLALSLQLLLAAFAAFAWAWVRWSRGAAWAAGAPCVLAALWLCCSVGTRLLPALV